MDEVQLAQGYRAITRRRFTFVSLSSQKLLVLTWATSQEWKAESTLEPPNGFEHGTRGFGIQGVTR